MSRPLRLLATALLVSACSSPAPTVAPSASPTLIAVVSTPSPSPQPTPSPTPSPTATPTSTPIATPTITPRPTPTPTPHATLSLPGDTVTWTDPTGDLLDTDTEKHTTGPRYVDAKKVIVAVRNGRLLVDFFLAGTPPDELDPTYTTLGYYLLIDRTNDNDPDFTVDMDSIDGWGGSLFIADSGQSFDGDAFPGTAVISADHVAIAMDMSAIGSPGTFRVRALIQWEDFPDPIGHPLDSKAVEDRIPGKGTTWSTIVAL